MYTCVNMCVCLCVNIHAYTISKVDTPQTHTQAHIDAPTHSLKHTFPVCSRPDT